MYMRPSWLARSLGPVPSFSDILMADESRFYIRPVDGGVGQSVAVKSNMTVVISLHTAAR